MKVQRYIVMQAAIATVCLTVIAGGAALAQGWGQQKRPPEKTVYTNLSSRVSIPDLPDYSGPSKFLNGSAVTGRGSGVVYLERWILKDNIQQAHEWYRATMTNYGWKITLSTKSSIYAQKDGSTCSVIFNGSYHPGWNSEIVINYSPKER